MGVLVKHIVLFRCEWFDLTLNRGMRVHKQYEIVEIQAIRRYTKYDLFIFSQQATQVYYASYPSNHEKVDWFVVINVKAQSTIGVPMTNTNVETFQADGLEVILPVIVQNDELINLRDNEGGYEEVDRPNANKDYEKDAEDDEKDDDAKVYEEDEADDDKDKEDEVDDDKDEEDEEGYDDSIDEGDRFENMRDS